MSAIKNKVKENNSTSTTGPITRKRGRPAKSEPTPVEVVNKNQGKDNDKKETRIENEVKGLNVSKSNTVEQPTTIKRKRGRPAKMTTTATNESKEKLNSPDTPKRGRGRPRKPTPNNS
ncbi:uncharacterized protein BX663DRAFT_498183 [Cokeromyces recurvatus]|uniref:uncharacterized protein n=1 Tax=Cokeromyces recurvatus TaxID=90255 RepID=UPI0022205D34|nr:uncharacterized protein BX663DRAFT_498183 [Cokeromyces recurvatus]KAI7905939.1 hypothetical protein BX663DRAFT_498183 [Cokeromyces recurvatus]